MAFRRKYYTRILVKWKSIFICVCFFSQISCEKFVEIDPPVNNTISDEIFKSDGLAISAIAGIYSEMMSSSSKFTAGSLTFFAGMYADELTLPNSPLQSEFINNQITEANHLTLVNSFWDKAYKFIYTANICLEKMNGPSSTISDSTKRMLEGECRFIRAFCYFHMVNLFGPIPLPVVSDFEVNMTLPRSPISKVYELIIQDLEIAKDLLKTQYPSAERVRPNKWAVMALLAKVYLYQNEWAKAEDAASQIINSTLYSLEPLNSVFLKSSNEAIWQLLPVNTTLNNTWEGNILLPPSNSYILTDTLFRSFEPNDQRKTAWVSSRTTGSPPGIKYYPSKYKVKINTSKLEYYMVFRLAEQYLIRAEARAHLNKITEAAEDINRIRSRANLPNTTANTQVTLYGAIAQERKIEFFAEWGNRWFDLKRTQRADAELNVIKQPGWSLNDTLWPIPVTQIFVNPNLTQNPGY